MQLTRRWAPAVAWMAAIFVFSGQPGLRVSDDPGVDGPIRHAAHVLTYALLAVLLLRGLGWGDGRSWTIRLAGVAVVMATLYGATDELHQTFVPQRAGNLVDIGWDLLGALIGVAAARFLSGPAGAARLRATRLRGGSAMKRG